MYLSSNQRAALWRNQGPTRGLARTRRPAIPFILPDNGVVRAEVVVNKPVSHPGNLTPLDLRVLVPNGTVLTPSQKDADCRILMTRAVFTVLIAVSRNSPDSKALRPFRRNGPTLEFQGFRILNSELARSAYDAGM